MNQFLPRSTLRPEVAAFLCRQHRLPIGDQWLAARGGATRAVVDPGTGQPIAPVAEGGAADMAVAGPVGRKVFESAPWRSTKPAQRQQLELRLADKTVAVSL